MPIIRTRAAKGALLESFEADNNMKRGVSSKSADYTAELSDNRDTLVVTGTTTITLPVASSILSASETGDYRVTIVNGGSDTVTVAKSSSDTINGEASITLAPGDAVKLVAISTGYVVESSHHEAPVLPDTLIPSGTKMLFQQTTPPTGWTKVTSNVDGRALRVVSGTVGSGGTNSFTTAFNSARTSSSSGTGATGSAGAHTHTAQSATHSHTSTQAHTLTIDQIPSHNHRLRVSVGSGNQSGQIVQTGNPSNANLGWNDTLIESAGGGQGHSHGIATGGAHTHSTDSQGSHTHTGPAHTHTVNLDVLYLDVIIAQRD